MKVFKFRPFLVWTVSLWVIVPQTAAKDLPDLRILPLGDSITKGSLSSDGNGYRNYLETKLLNYNSAAGTKVDMIGTLHDGSMADYHHEGHSGEFVENIINYWQKPFTAGPNVVLIHVGTNNMDLNQQVGEAPGRYSNMLDEMYVKLPDALIIVCKVIHSKNPNLNARADAFNAKLETMVQQRSDAGRSILLVDMGMVDSDINDSKHPTDAGYAKMAEGWYKTIIKAHESGMIKAHGTSNPTGVGIGERGNGDAPAGSASCEAGNWKRIGKVFDDFKVWKEVGSIFSGAADFSRDKLIFADLDGDGFDDYILADHDGKVRAWLMKGLAAGTKYLEYIQPSWEDLNVTGDMIRMADVTGDGKADMILLYSDGAAKVWENVGDGTTVKFKSLDSKWATGLESREKIRFQDMDGDGYADYVVLYDGGAVSWARNTHNNGADSSKPNWSSLQEIAPGVEGAPPKSVHLIDLDGDKRADYVIIYQGGSVKALRNSGNLNRDSNRRNWHDFGTIAPGIAGTTGDMIRFADLSGDGLADFLQVEDDGSIRMWSNQGLVGADVSKLRFADLTGDGRADLIYVDAVGRAFAWVNAGLGNWQKVGRIATIRDDEDLSDSRILFADVNGDGLADYLIVYGGGAVKAWLNNGNIGRQDGQRLWTGPYEIAPGVAENSDGSKVRFADLNGDGFADYLVLWDGGAVDAWLNQQQIPPNGRQIWRAKETVATGVGEPGSKIRFVQLNDDGKSDYIIQYDGGSAKAYLNTGDIPGSSDKVNWINIGAVAAGVGEPGPVFYADIDGDGKDDYLVSYADGSVNAWINVCDWVVKDPPDTPNPGDGDPDDGDDPYVPDPGDDEPFPTCPYSPATMDELSNLNYNNEVPPRCVPKYMLAILLALLEDLTNRYNDMLDDDYDHFYDVYSEYIVKNSEEVLYNFMLDESDHYYHCKIWQQYPCCTSCDEYDWDCTGCLDPCEILSGQDNGIRYKLRDQPCPPDYSQRNNIKPKEYQSIIWSFKNDGAEDNFWGAVEAEVGAPRKRFEIVDHEYVFTAFDDPEMGNNGACEREYNLYGWDGMKDTCQQQYFWSYSPHLNGFVADDVFNPKDTVEKVMKNIKDDVIQAIAELTLAVIADEYYSDENDLVDALALPVFMLQAALDSMQSVLDMGKDIEETETKEFIINLFSSLLVVASMGGGALVEAGWKLLGKWLVRAAESGHAAISLVAVVENPDSAPLLIFGLIMSGRTILETQKVAKAATLRRSMKYEEITSFNKEVGALMKLEEELNKKPASSSVCKVRFA
ncbi:hypothetical protein O988_06345 [Pseudogymnoascus sp. VKM F-3808]|nr:hypothetical protein O988_06345 [Pseudogymnoascus sp. VKM F-3808]